MLILVLFISSGFALLWGSVYLVLIGFRRRLPFYNVTVTESHLTPMSTNGLMRFVVRFRYHESTSCKLRDWIVFVLSGYPDQVANSSKFQRLQSFYSVGRTLRLHYVPGLEGLFGCIPESPDLPPGTVIATIVVISCSLILSIFWLRTG